MASPALVNAPYNKAILMSISFGDLDTVAVPASLTNPLPTQLRKANGDPLEFVNSITSPWDGSAVDLSGFDEAQIDVQITSGTVLVETSLDGSIWDGQFGKNMKTGADVSAGAISASGKYTFPATGFIRATAVGGTSAFILLRR